MGPFSMVLSAAASLLAAAPLPTFAPTYSEAVALAHQEHKPLAVFLGTGSDGLAKLVADGGFGDAGGKLKSEFVCLYVDTTTPAGQKLAADFEMTQGLVISDRTGEKQALRHAGTVAAPTLASYAATYAAPNLAFTRTVYAGTSDAPVAAPVTAAPVYTPAPLMTAPNYYRAPMYSFPMSGGCASGRCPNAR